MNTAAASGPRIANSSQVRDMTELEQANSALRACEDRYRRMVETTHEGMCLLDLDSRITFANTSLCEMLGYAEHELVGRNSFDLMQSHIPGQLHESLSGTEDVALRRRDGGIVWAIVSGVPVFDDGARPEGLMATFTNVTDRRQSEDALREREARFRALIENSNDVVIILDPAGEVLYQSPSIRHLIGQDANCIGHNAFANLHPDDAGDVQSAFAALVADPSLSVPLAGRFLHPDGTWHSVEGTGTNLLDDPSVGGLVANFRDVTQRKEAEQRAQTAARQIEQLTADAVIITDSAGKVVSWNDGAERMFDWKADEILGLVLPLVPLEERPAGLVGLRSVIDGGVSVTQEAQRLARDGRVVMVLGSWSPVPLENGETGVLGILKDITEHKQTTAQLREQAKSLAVLRERERIAMDLHDGVIQSLYGITLSLGALRRKADIATPAKDWAPVLGDAIGNLTDIIQGVRDYIFDLRSGLPEEGDLASGLAALAHQLETSAGAQARLVIASDVADIAPASAAIILYVAQEALSNVARHAHAREVAIEVGRSRGRWVLVIRDNGRGFDPAKRGRRRGDGLHNMRERARVLGGTLTVRSKAGLGTTVRLVFA